MTCLESTLATATDVLYALLQSARARGPLETAVSLAIGSAAACGVAVVLGSALVATAMVAPPMLGAVAVYRFADGPGRDLARAAMQAPQFGRLVYAAVRA